MIIYCAINKINGKKYVGQSTLTLDERRKSHLHDCKYKDYVFGRAINKYGIDAFEWEILYTCSSIDEMIEKEKQFIALYDLYNSGKGYNASPGGEFQTQERRKSISESLSKSLMGHKLSEETKRKISRSRMGQKRSVESRLKQGLTNHGRDS
jgi:group I intron endonuclease